MILPIGFILCILIVSPKTAATTTDEYFIFLQKFPLQHTFQKLFHTEVLVCPRSNFSSIDQETLDEGISSMQYFLEIDASWWESKSIACIELGYGGSYCTDACCSVPFGDAQKSFKLNERRAIIPNADVQYKSLFLYGVGMFDGITAHNALCDQKCWSTWSGTDYNPITNNCNTFTSTVLSCVYGLSQEKPNLGPSDMITVDCNCTPNLY